MASAAAFLPSVAWGGAPTWTERPVFRQNAWSVVTDSTALLDAKLARITGFALCDATSGEVLDSYQTDLMLPPASVTKAITAVYARSVLGADYRFVTRLFATGPIVEGVVQGDIYLVGGGDPALDTDELAELAEAAVLAGVRGLTGQFYVDGSALPNITEVDPTQPDHLGYNPSVGGLNLNFNRLYFEWKQTVSGYDLRLDARGIEHKPLVRWVDIKTENRGAPVFAYSKLDGHDRWSVAESALGKGGGRWLPVRQPADYAGEVFRTLAAVTGLQLPAHKLGKAPALVREIARFESNPLDEVLRWMLKYSNNLTAECLGLMAAVKLGRQPASLRDSAVIMNQWARDNLGVMDVEFHNHSGLTDLSRVSAGQMVKMLAHPYSQTQLDGLLKKINVLDRRGNLIDTGTVEVVAKTGTLNFTHGLAGYLEKAGRKYSFAIFTADIERRANIPMAKRERPEGAKVWLAIARKQENALLRQWAAELP